MKTSGENIVTLSGHKSQFMFCSVLHLIFCLKEILMLLAGVCVITAVLL